MVLNRFRFIFYDSDRQTWSSRGIRADSDGADAVAVRDAEAAQTATAPTPSLVVSANAALRKVL